MSTPERRCSVGPSLPRLPNELPQQILGLHIAEPDMAVEFCLCCLVPDGGDGRISEKEVVAEAKGGKCERREGEANNVFDELCRERRECTLEVGSCHSGVHLGEAETSGSQEGKKRKRATRRLASSLYLAMSRIRTFAFVEGPEAAPLQPAPAGPAPDADEDVAEPLPSSPLTLALSRKGSSYILVHPVPTSNSAPNERQYAIINALVQADPFPELGEGGRSRLWLKIGAGKSGEVGGENEGLLENLVAAGIVKEGVFGVL